VAGDWQTIITELEAYGSALADKPRITALNKIDALDDDERAKRKAAIEAVAGPVMMMSGVTREGLTEVLRAVRAEIARGRTEATDAEDEAPWRP